MRGQKGYIFCFIQRDFRPHNIKPTSSSTLASQAPIQTSQQTFLDMRSTNLPLFAVILNAIVHLYVASPAGPVIGSGNKTLMANRGGYNPTLPGINADPGPGRFCGTDC
ncbi:hypothetical protein PtB15_11B94 [Puccinia triticina]|nr:hypothetical protein PtB15_11B94 [Puccinia triticina]